MKVLMFGWEFPPFNSGGLGVACQGLARALVGKGVELIFVLPKRLDIKGEPFRIIYAEDKLSLVAINSLLVPYITSDKYGKARGCFGKNCDYASSLLEEVRRYAALAAGIAKKESFDVIHAHDWLSFAAGLAAKEVSGKPLIVHVHATEVDRTAGKVNELIYANERHGLEKADKIITVSDFTKQMLVDYYGIYPDKVSVVHNGIDLASYNLDAPSDFSLTKLKKSGFKIVLYVGRITIQKGPDYLVWAAKKVLEYQPKTMFVIVGSGDMEGQIMNQVASLGISDKFLFPGFLRGRELSEVFKSADLFVMPSVSEPFGLTCLESLAHGIPVIVSKQSGVSEVLDHALKVDFWDVDEMADKILSVLKHKSLKKTLEQNGQKEALMNTWDKSAQKCLNIYNSLTI